MRRIPGYRAAFSLLAIGATIVAASIADFFPLHIAARLLSGDGVISDALARRIATSQGLLGVCLCLASSIPVLASRTISLGRDALTRLPRGSFLAALAIASLLATLVFQHAVLQPIPHVTDETCHYFQGKILASGKLYAPLPPCPEHFVQPNMIMTDTGKWFARYLPGQAILLAIGFIAKAPSVMVPIASALCAVLLVLLAARFYDVLTARMLGILFAVSPLGIILGASYMSHATSLCFLLLATLALLRGVESRTGGKPALRWDIAGGAALGMAALVRPTEIIIAALTGGIALLVLPSRERNTVMHSAPGVILGALPACAAVFAWNHALLGSALAFNYTGDSSHVLFRSLTGQYGFGGDFTARHAVTLTLWTVLRFDAALLGWPVTLVFAPLALVRKPSRADVVCFAATGIVIGFYFFYSYYGAEYEARYYYLALPFALVLVIRGLRNASLMTARALGDGARDLGVALGAAFFLHGLIAYWSGYILPMYGQRYEDTSPMVVRAAERDALTDAIVLIDTSPPRGTSYSAGFPFNDPLLQARVIFAQDLAAGIDCLAKAFPGRRIHRFVPNDERTDGHFEETKP